MSELLEASNEVHVLLDHMMLRACAEELGLGGQYLKARRRLHAAIVQELYDECGEKEVSLKPSEQEEGQNDD